MRLRRERSRPRNRWTVAARIAPLLLICIVLLLAIGVAPPAAAAVLNPYSLPSQQPWYANPPRAEQAGTSAVRDSFYQRFADETKTLKKDDRAALVRSFTQKKDNALQAGRIDEAQHYGRLVQILEANN